MVDHSILLKKLENFGIRGIALKWMESYLSNRHQFVSVNGSDSNTQLVVHGVPQGSILGPLLFIVYINDIVNTNKICMFVLYADDANILITGNSISEIEEIFNTLSKNLDKWVNLNGLALNLNPS